MQQHAETPQHSAIVQALEELNHTIVQANGVALEAGKCYHYSLDPIHVLFNDNCPGSLKQEIKRIFKLHNIELPIAD